MESPAGAEMMMAGTRTDVGSWHEDEVNNGMVYPSEYTVPKGIC